MTAFDPVTPRHWLTALIDLMDRPEWRIVGAIGWLVMLPIALAMIWIVGVAG